MKAVDVVEILGKIRVNVAVLDLWIGDFLGRFQERSQRKQLEAEAPIFLAKKQACLALGTPPGPYGSRLDLSATLQANNVH